MRKSKKLLSILTALALTLSIPLTALAHGGRTDRFGGHWDKEKNEYHYHRDTDGTFYSDYHMHMMSEEYSKFFKKVAGMDMNFDIPIEEVDGDKIIELLDEADLDRAFVLSGSYILGMPGMEGKAEHEDVMKENNYLAIEVSKHPNRLVGFFSVNPLKDYALEEIDRCYDTLKLTGLKLHFTNSDVDLNNPEHLEKVRAVFQKCALKNIPILLHLRSRNPEFGKKDAEILIDELISKTPGLKLQIAHLGGWGGFDRTAREVLGTFIERYENNPSLDKRHVFFDLGGMIVTEREEIPSMLEITTEEDLKEMASMMRQWGLSNIAFATDYSYQTPAKYMDYFNSKLPLCESELEDIMDNDVLSSFGIDIKDRFPNYNELHELLKEGVDYNVPFSAEY